jgi:hypothetical protein
MLGSGSIPLALLDPPPSHGGPGVAPPQIADAAPGSLGRFFDARPKQAFCLEYFSSRLGVVSEQCRRPTPTSGDSTWYRRHHPL